MTSLTSAPTRREIILVVILLITLVSLPRRHLGFTARPVLAPPHDDTHSSLILGGAQAVPKPFRTRLSWGSAPVPDTKIVSHVPGWTIFDNMYILNGTVFIVSDQPEKIPDRETMTSAGLIIENGKAAEEFRLPTDKDLRIISTKEARKLFGTGAVIMDGVSFFVNDPSQFITHYYHWSAELWFGFWRTYSSLDPSITSTGNTTLPPPRRIVFPHIDADHWRDYASMNEWVLHSSFPSVTSEFSHDWNDRARMGQPFVFDRVVFSDRAAAMYGFNYHRTQRTASEPFALPGSANWWSTIRSNVIEFSGLHGAIGSGTTFNPVITYISRQDWGRRMLIEEDHERLVEELYKLRDNHGYEVNVVSMDKLSRIEQLRLAARTTIMMGVHGNGLTSLVWMKPSPRSTVMEFFYPGGFARDYEYTTRALGMVHYGFWNSSSFTSPQVPDVRYPEGFQGNAIPIDGRAVARLCYDRLTLSEELDD